MDPFKGLKRNGWIITTQPSSASHVLARYATSLIELVPGLYQEFPTAAK